MLRTEGPSSSFVRASDSFGLRMREGSMSTDAAVNERARGCDESVKEMNLSTKRTISPIR